MFKKTRVIWVFQIFVDDRNVNFKPMKVKMLKRLSISAFFIAKSILFELCIETFFFKINFLNKNKKKEHFISYNP